LQVTGAQFLSQAENLQKEIFGNESLLVLVDDLDQAHQVLRLLEGNLTGTIYSASDGTDDIAYGRVASILRRKVGRLINDKMPTGVAVSSAMNHGGPFPATGHPSFTSVGIPAAITRFSQLQCFDNVSSNHLPVELQDENPLGIWRFIDGEWIH
jgi:NADP-dependent aldehyde dehydrogenase